MTPFFSFLLFRYSLKYGGSIYDHLTGKNPKLEKGIDYNIDEDGGINRSSLTAAYDKLANLFLQNGGQAWINASEELAKKHEIATEEELVSLSRSDGTTEMKNRYIRPYRRTDGWIYYESNYYNKTIQQMTQPNREKTKYRVYFNVENKHVISVFQDIINNLEGDPTLQKYGFQIKTADLLCKPSNADIGRITGQKDKIVAYFGEEGINRALPILRKYVEENLSKFKATDILLSMPLTDSNAKTIDGISVSSELKGYIYDGTNTRVYKSFNDFQSIIIDLVLDSVIKKVKSDTSLFLYNSPLNEKMSNLNANQLSRKNDYLRAILSHAEGKQFLLKEIQAKYNEYVKQCGINPCNIAFQES